MAEMGRGTVFGINCAMKLTSNPIGKKSSCLMRSLHEKDFCRDYLTLWLRVATKSAADKTTPTAIILKHRLGKFFPTLSLVVVQDKKPHKSEADSTVAI